jgi:hypothetical protein
MGGVGVGIVIARKGGDPHWAGGLEDRAGFFAAIGDEDRFQHASQ